MKGREGGGCILFLPGVLPMALDHAGPAHLWQVLRPLLEFERIEKHLAGVLTKRVRNLYDRINLKPTL